MIEYEDAVLALKTIVNRVPLDYVYKRDADVSRMCVYMLDGQPSCLVGHAFIELGIPAEVVAEGGPGYDNDQPANEVSVVDRLPDIPMSDDTLAIFSAAQTLQDRGMPWHQVTASVLDGGVRLNEDGEPVTPGGFRVRTPRSS